MKKTVFAFLWVLTLLAGLEARSVAKQVGPAIVVSPNPETYVDPVYENLEAVMDNFFQPPYYPGATPYLSKIWYTSKAFTSGVFVINPVNDKIMHFTLGQNFIYDDTDYFKRMIPSNSFATSRDGGKTWKYGPPIEQIIPLGGSISQLVNASLGPGLSYTYTKEGKLYAYGNGYFDLHPNPPHTVPTTGFLFTQSHNEGKTWAPVDILTVSNFNWWFPAGTSYAQGLGPNEFYISPDPSNSDIIHGATSFNVEPFGAFSSVYYMHSKNGGKTFSKPFQVYRLLDDPVFVKKYFDYYVFGPIAEMMHTLGGYANASGPPLVVDDNTILIPILRYFVKRGVKTMDFQHLRTFNADIAFVRSEDRGKTWEKVAGATDLFMGDPNNVYDPGFADPFAKYLINGVRVDGLFLEGALGRAPALQSSSPLVSPFTGRLYACYAANNPAFGETPIQFFPRRVVLANTSNCILLSVSCDKGKTFSHAVQVNRTPTDISMGAQQAFNQNMIMTDDGHLVIAYYDFRNWKGTVGEIAPPPVDNTSADMPPLPTDVWLAIYKEVDDPKGGSTGVGLDFVEEIRVTPESFDARLGYQGFKSVPYATGTPEAIPLAKNSNNVLHVIYSVTVPSNGSVDFNGYKGMVVNTNSFFELRMKRYQFPKPSNQ